MTELDELYNNSLNENNKSDSSVETIVDFFPGEEELKEQHELQKNLMEENTISDNENQEDEKEDYETKITETDNDELNKKQIKKIKKKKKLNKKSKKNKITLIAKDKKIEKPKLSSQELAKQFSQSIKHKFKKRSNSLIKNENKDIENIINNNNIKNENEIKIIRSSSTEILSKSKINELSESEEENKQKKIKKKFKKKNLKQFDSYYLKKIKEKDNFIDHLQKVRKLFIEKKFIPEKYFTYVINPGNASYLIKKAMNHRINWRESQMSVTSLFNFKWQQNC